MSDLQNKMAGHAPETMKRGLKQRGAQTTKHWEAKGKSSTNQQGNECVLQGMPTHHYKSPHGTKIQPIIFDHIDRPDNINHGNLIALTIDPIVGGFHLTRARMGINSGPNLLRQDKLYQIGITARGTNTVITSSKRCRSRCKGQALQANHPGGCLRITKQTRYQRAILWHYPLIQ